MSDDFIVNRTFNEIRVGDTASLVRTLTAQDLRLFAALSGDVNPAHLDEDYAPTSTRAGWWAITCGAAR